MNVTIKEAAMNLKERNGCMEGEMMQLYYNLKKNHLIKNGKKSWVANQAWQYMSVIR